MNIDEMDGLYKDVWYMINLRTKAERIEFFKFWVEYNLEDDLE